MDTVSTTPVDRGTPSGRFWFWFGMAVSFSGIAAYLVQFFVFKQLSVMPWYAPLLASLGVAMVFLSLRKRRTTPRLLGLLLVVIVAGFEWFYVLSFTKLPPYAGPVVGEKLPSFRATLANGQAFANADLANDTSTVLVFFRGRW